MAALTTPDQQSMLTNNLSQLTITDGPADGEQKNNAPAIFSFGAQPTAAAAPMSAVPPSPSFFDAAAPSSSVPTSATPPSEAQSEGSTQSRSTWGVDTDYAAVQTKLNAVQEQLKKAVASKDYAAAGALQSEQSRLQEQFKTVYEAHQQMLQEKLQQRYSNGSASIMSAQEMEKIRIQVWIDYIQRTFTPDLELAVFQLLDIVLRGMTEGAKKGWHSVKVNMNGDMELKIMNAVMTSRVALTNFSWQLLEAGYDPSVPNTGTVRIGMLRSFEKQAAKNKPHSHKVSDRTIEKETFVNYFERGVHAQKRYQIVGLPATDVVSVKAVKLCYSTKMWYAGSG
jgi:hypothetical protein